MVNVSWYAATADCAWVSVRTGTVIRLPKETVWEFVAPGTGGRKHPWGRDAPKTSVANYDETNMGDVTPVGLFPAGNTPEVSRTWLVMSGNGPAVNTMSRVRQ